MSGASPSPSLTTTDVLDAIDLTMSVSPTPGATLLPDNSFLQPVVTPAPTPCHEVVIQLSTALVVKYDEFYPNTPIESFQPAYRALADGSLISPPLDEEQRSANLSLLVIGALAAVFLRNIYASADYIHRGKVKKKTLFYLLLASQLLAPVSLTPIIVSFFTENVNCTAVVHISYLAAMISLGILITGILGIKAYKCLENPRILLFVLGLLQLAATAFVILDVIMTRGTRRLTGSCVLQVSDMKFTRYFVSTQFFQSLLISLCFVYACFKSRGSPASRGRMSVRMSMDDLPIQMPPDPDDSYTKPQSRGWWDHVPDVQPDRQDQSRDRDESTSEKRSIGRVVRPGPSQMNQSFGTQRDWDSQDRSRTDESLGVGEDSPNRVRLRQGHSPTLSAGSRLSRLVPRNVFRQVVKDELLYTTFITSTCVVVAILAFIGLNFKTLLSVTGWIILNWAIISLLTVHSFGRVTHRHEREAWIQESASRSIRIATTYSANGNRRAHAQTPSISRRRTKGALRRYRSDPNVNDPYSDTQPLDEERFSWQFGAVTPATPSLAPSLTRSPLLLRNPNPEIRPAQQIERVTSPLQRTVSWQSAATDPRRPNKF